MEEGGRAVRFLSGRLRGRRSVKEERAENLAISLDELELEGGNK
jgi:hypothetical protein